ncbi:MAG: hypothetical protein WCO33_03295 [bacterium]
MLEHEPDISKTDSIDQLFSRFLCHTYCADSDFKIYFSPRPNPSVLFVDECDDCFDPKLSYDLYPWLLPDFAKTLKVKYGSEEFGIRYIEQIVDPTQMYYFRYVIGRFGFFDLKESYRSDLFGAYNPDQLSDPVNLTIQFLYEQDVLTFVKPEVLQSMGKCNKSVS